MFLIKYLAFNFLNILEPKIHGLFYFTFPFSELLLVWLLRFRQFVLYLLSFLSAKADFEPS
jgi:hypothetical protein